MTFYDDIINLLNYPLFWYWIELFGFSFLILACIKLRKNEPDFNYSNLLIISSLYHISLMIKSLFFPVYLPEVFFPDLDTLSQKFIDILVSSILDIITIGFFFIYIGLKNKELHGKWLIWSGITWFVAKSISFVSLTYFFNIYPNLGEYYNSPFTLNTWILFRCVSALVFFLFMVFGFKLRQKYIVISAILLMYPHIQQLITLIYFKC